MTPLNIPLEFVVIGAVIVAALGFIFGTAMTVELNQLLEGMFVCWFSGYCSGWLMNIVRVKFEQWIS